METLRHVSLVHRELPPSKAALTRSAILDAASQFLQQRPFRDLKVGDLMKTVGASRSTFYLYFNDLHGLMECLLDEVKGGIVEGSRAWLSNEGVPVVELRKSLRALVDVTYDHGAILRAVADAAPRDERLEHVWEAFVGSFDQVVAARIEQDQSNGMTPVFDALPVARALNRMDASILIEAFGTSQKADKEQVLAALLRIWISTLYPSEITSGIGAVTQSTERSPHSGEREDP